MLKKIEKIGNKGVESADSFTGLIYSSKLYINFCMKWASPKLSTGETTWVY